ncbi:MAG: hypothetical protein DME84_02885 [Verrucomicrobia bacterium]|nr:MAG: hypothetical protein DME84_02885 [Verrucomicrobiota bacterium]
MLQAIGRKPTAAPKPVLVKISPDLSSTELEAMLAVCEENAVAGIIATNTTVDHSSVPLQFNQEGGLSGLPLREKSTYCARLLGSPQYRRSRPVEFSTQNRRTRNFRPAHSSFSFTPGSFIAGRDYFAKSWKRNADAAAFLPMESTTAARREVRESDHDASVDVALQFAEAFGAVRL